MVFGKKKAIVFGCGNGGRRGFAWARKRYDVVGFFDNDSRKHGSDFLRLPVLNPNRALGDEYSECVFLLASVNRDEMRDQLLALGILDNRIIIVPPWIVEDRVLEHFKGCVKKAFLSAPAKQIVYPIYTIAWVPIATCVMLFRAFRCVGRLNEYLRFNAVSGINTLFYWTVDLNFRKCGRKGVSDTLATGEFELARLWWFPSVGLRVYRRASVLLVPLSFVGWVVGLTVFSELGLNGTLLVGFLIFASSMFYLNALVVQNYNALGWAFFPFIVHGLLSGEVFILALGLAGAGISSLTVAFVGCVLTVGFSLVTFNWSYSVGILFPAVLVLNRWIILFRSKRIGAAGLREIAELIGLTRSKRRYRYTIAMSWRWQRTYLLALYIVFGGVLAWRLELVPWLYLGAVALFIINTCVARFADVQTSQIAVLTVALGYLIRSPDSVCWLLAIYLLNPLPIIAEAYVSGNGFVLPIFAPFHVRSVLDKVSEFFGPVSKNSRVLYPQIDPNDEYERLFFGNRRLVEAASFAANEKGVLCFPDWWAIMRNNYEGAKGFWGIKPEEAFANAKEWKADYVIAQLENGSPLSSKWNELGFSEVSCLNWDDLKTRYFRSEKVYTYDSLEWRLMKVPDAGIPEDASGSQ